MPRTKAKALRHKAEANEAAAASLSTDMKKKRRWRAGTVVKREIKKYQQTTNTLIPKSVMYGFIRSNTNAEGMRWRKDALVALHLCAEEMVTTLLKKAQLIATHQGRETIRVNDLKLVQVMKEP